MAAIKLRDGSTTADRRLDRIPQFDERSRNFAIAEVVPSDIRGKTWGQPGPRLDQGHEGACVGFGVTHELLAWPAPVSPTTATAKFAREAIYWEAQRNDPWAGGAYPGASPFSEGTSVLEGVKAAQRLGYYGEYRWAFTVEDIMRAVSHEGPVVVGVDWYEGMDRYNAAGLVHPTGSVRGGHCFLIRGLILKPTLAGRTGYGPLFRCRNSWGIDWGVNGDFYIPVEEYAEKLLSNGEAVVPIRRAITP